MERKKQRKRREKHEKFIKVLLERAAEKGKKEK